MDVEKETTQFENTKCSTAAVITFSLGLVAGTFSAVFCKGAYETTVEMEDGSTKPFAKPIMMLLLMFGGMVPAIFFWMLQQAFVDPKDREHITWNNMVVLIIPCVCDLLCTLLLLIAQLYITASMWQMLRGSVICITAVLKRFVLNHRLRNHMWVGVGIITAAMIIVASVPFLTPEDKSDNAPPPGDAKLGIMLVLLGCLAQGVQYVFEEKVMAVDNIPPLVVIGFEGIWGTLLTLLIVYPVANMIPGQDLGGRYESSADSLNMIARSPLLQNLLIGFVLTVTVYNCLVVYVTKYLSAIWHAILDNFRPLTIWMLGLFIHYSINPKFGEVWVYPGSIIQLIGLLFLFLGTAVYDGKVFTCDDPVEYQPLNTSAAAAGDYDKTPINMQSTHLTKSPLVYRKDRESLARDEALAKRAQAVLKNYTDA